MTNKKNARRSQGLSRRSVLGLSLQAALPLLGAAQVQNALAADAAAPTQPGKLDGKVDGKISAESFFRAPQMTGAALSPDGKRLAMRTLGPHGRMMLTVLTLESMSPQVVYSSEAADLNNFVWVNNERLAFDLTDRETPAGKIDAAPGLFAVNHDGSSFKQLVERQRVWARNGNDTQSLAPWNTFLLNGETQRQGDTVLAVRPESYDEKGVGFIKLLRLNTRNGRSEEIEGPLHTEGWWADPQGNLRVAQTREGAKGAIRWRDPASGAWRVLAEYDAFTGGDLGVSHVGSDGKLYVTARRGRDKQAMWLLDPSSGVWSSEPLAESPQFDVDAQVIARQDKVLGLRFRIDAEVTQWLDGEMRGLQAQVDKVLPRTVNRLSVPWQGASPWVLVEAFADIQPTLYFLFNRETKKFTRLGAERPDIVAKNQAGSDMVRFKARDGLEIPAWLTLPPGLDAASAKHLPLLVLVHGGPFVRGPGWHWDAEVQLLAARGYAVLQPQFRGTVGFGLAHYQAGWRQWGKAMQTDLADAANWAVAQGLADPKRMAIAGASYGGYAALMGLVRNPELFRCAISWVGLTDLDLFASNYWDDISPIVKTQGLAKVLGDRVQDAADLKANSPLTHAAAIKQPVLLAYGSADRRVPLVHGESFSKAMKAANSQVEYVVYQDEGHGWRVPANQLDFWNRSLRFLDRHLAKP
ncbi:prolyl oligopeptidase family serine peptidase [Paucibacter sp. Y2R2-4]|uniref:prolyl oligopeptidase family serine peptidase n=1 Tax=Paucibacter sp. Y2R2-4 TaxID=2893553 RepID=UPI0021E3D73E|nr:prolyl oligopeptidase family serine peptidase [Paucibacter sp. Y2R2-4]MCV2352049.1 prolyl oligopeptidase family serine peptidase [Paucibacter sp. Y2R2-4]